jgi:hypothetical protein
VSGLRKRDVLAARRITLWVTISVGLAGVLCFVGFLATGTDRRSVLPEVLYLLASILVSTALVSLVLGQATVSQQALEMRATVDRAIEDALTPLRAGLTDDGQADYRWHSLVGAPSDDDPWPEYLWQRIEISKRLPTIPDELRVAVVADDGDSTFESFTGDGRYLARWFVDEDLPVDDSRVFTMGPVHVDGVPLAPTVKQRTVGRTHKVREFRYRVPRVLRDSHASYLVAFSFDTRKHVASDTRVTFRTQVFTDTHGAEFRCTIAPSLDPTKFFVTTTGVTLLGPGKPCASPVADTHEQPGPWSIGVRFDAPLQKGSSVEFHVERGVR